MLVHVHIGIERRHPKQIAVGCLSGSHAATNQTGTSIRTIRPEVWKVTRVDLTGASCHNLEAGPDIFQEPPGKGKKT